MANDIHRKAEFQERMLKRQLARSVNHGRRVSATAEHIATTAAAMDTHLKKQLPRLRAELAAATTDDERATARRQYLEAVTNRHRCQQAYQASRRQSAIAANL